MKKIISIILIGLLLICLWNPLTNIVKAEDNDWWNTDWEFRKEITINHDMVVSDIDNFPILFHNISSDFSYKPQDLGWDFVFISSDGTKQYNHEIEYYHRNTGELIAWVNISSLSSTEDTTLYIYYGNPSCSNQENVAGTWNSDFVGVWHCNNDVDNGIDDIKDSTAYNNHGTTQNMEYEDLVEGKISKAFNFDGNNEKVLVYDSQHNSLDLTDSMTLECWWNADDLSNSYNTLMGKSSEMGAYQYEYRIRDTMLTDNIYSLLTYGGLREDDKTHSTNTWYHGVVTLDSSNVIFYNEGAISTIHDSADLLSVYGQFGFGAAGDYGYYFTGIIDEVRVSKISRSENWIETSYNTMNNPSWFLEVGSEENKPEENNPPNAPDVNGPDRGNPEIEYEYTFNSTDPDGDPVMYFVDWGDNKTEWTEFSDSGQEILLKHTWLKNGDYLIRAKSKDINNAESDWTEIEMLIPRPRTTFYSLLSWLFNRFPLLERLLGII
jgi:hypothetical protein